MRKARRLLRFSLLLLMGSSMTRLYLSTNISPALEFVLLGACAASLLLFGYALGRLRQILAPSREFFY